MSEIFIKKGNIAVRKLGEEFMLYDNEHDKIHILNATGAILWDLLDGDNSILEIKGLMQKKFPEISPETISQDTDEIITKLKVERLIKLKNH